MNIEQRYSPRTLLLQSHSCQALGNSMPLTQSRVPSPRKSNDGRALSNRNLVSRRESLDALPTPPSRFQSPDEGKDLAEKSVKWKNFVASFPTPVKAVGETSESSSSPAGNPLSLSKRRRDSIQSYDSIPTPPSRYESPDAKERGRVEMPDQIKKVLVSSLVKDCDSTVTKREEDAPLDPTVSTTVSTHETSAVDEDDVRSTLVSRIPPHIKSQLPLNEWYRILRPSLLLEAPCPESDSIYSDLSYGFSDDRSQPSAATGEIYDDLYGTDDEEEEVMMAHEVKDNRRPRIEDSEIDADDDAHNIIEDDSNGQCATKTQLSEGDQIMEDSEIANGAQKTSEQEKRTVQENSGHAWMDAHRLTYHTIYYSTDQESKDQGFEEDLEGLEMEQESESANHESASPVQRVKKRVSFGRAQVRWHERILDVHPCTSSGPSIGIGWKYFEGEEPIIWDNETSDEMRLSRRVREEMISNLGYSTRDIAKAVRKTLKIKNQRRRTINNLQAKVVNIEKAESVAENVQRKIRKLQSRLVPFRKSHSI